MSTDNYDPKNLEICKNDAVFQHFPMQKLLDNPGTWSALKYKYGRLIVKDSNDIEWIYVIKSGEARVLKHLEPGRVDVKARRKKIQQQMEEQSSYHKQKKILDFIEDGNGRKSRYAPSNYHPTVTRRPSSQMSERSSKNDYRFRSQSAIPAFARAQTSRPGTRRERPVTTCATRRRDETSGDSDKENNEDNPEECTGPCHHPSTGEISIIVSGDDDVYDQTEETKRATFEDDQDPRPVTASTITRSPRFIETPHIRSSSGRSRGKNSSRDETESMALPPFVQIETLHPGHTFGLRSCLEHDERGPSVSLVSGECEVLAINKKFFMKHCDDALISLIRLKAKPFPSQTELVDRLDANMQWEEFKQDTLKDFLRHRVRQSR